MEITFPSRGIENFGCFRSLIMSFPRKSWPKVVDLWRKIAKLGKDDPRRIIHSLKAGLALILVLLLYYLDPVYDSFGANAIWAIITVIIMIEFSVGATIGKGLNRTLATLVACALGFGAHSLASLSGETGKPILIAIFIFIIAAAVSFTRFFPGSQARYDHGLVVFILTFSLILISGYREEGILKMAKERILTILIGACIVVLVTTCICPVWMGEDLHSLVAGNLDKLGTFLEGFGREYFKVYEDGKLKDGNSLHQGYKTVLTSKCNEEIMVNLARWEPAHGRFRCGHPWKQYAKIGTLARQCAYKIQDLNSLLMNSAIQNPSDIRRKIQEPCRQISSECGKALKELASSIVGMTRTNLDTCHIANSKLAAENLKSIVKKGQWGESDLLYVIPTAALASLLLEVIECTEKVAEAVHELALLAGFRSMEIIVLTESISQINPANVESHEITIRE
ncbi:conserved hypothetical protein [Ricinus communis]|uniref:Aluminum-activated malate transporter n=1 Tax=Ricinus communis TaxID=3988 RepID=B9RIZ5_RICCO|nr:conserved hypothetical protein [Ricinus communis]